MPVRRFVNVNALNPRIDKKLDETEIEYEILNVLTVEKGKHTAEELRLRIDKKFGANIEGYNFVINQLLSAQMIVADYDKDDKSRILLYTIANCPRCPFIAPLIEKRAPP